MLDDPLSKSNNPNKLRMELKQPILESKTNCSELEEMSQKNRITSKVLQSQERRGDNDESSL